MHRNPTKPTQQAAQIMALSGSAGFHKSTLRKRYSTRGVTGSLTLGGAALVLRIPFSTKLRRRAPGRGSANPLVISRFRTPERYERIELWASSCASSAANRMRVCSDAGRGTKLNREQNPRYRDWAALYDLAVLGAIPCCR